MSWVAIALVSAISIPVKVQPRTVVDRHNSSHHRTLILWPPRPRGDRSRGNDELRRWMRFDTRGERLTFCTKTNPTTTTSSSSSSVKLFQNFSSTQPNSHTFYLIFSRQRIRCWAHLPSSSRPRQLLDSSCALSPACLVHASPFSSCIEQKKIVHDAGAVADENKPWLWHFDCGFFLLIYAFSSLFILFLTFFFFLAWGQEMEIRRLLWKKWNTGWLWLPRGWPKSFISRRRSEWLDACFRYTHANLALHCAMVSFFLSFFHW